MTADSPWPRVGLGDLLLDLRPGFASGQHSSESAGVPHLRPMNVTTDGTIARRTLVYVDPALASEGVRLRPGDILFNNTNSPELVGKTALFQDGDSPAYSNHMTRLRVDETRVSSAYVALRLHDGWRQGWFAARCNNHVSQASISREVLKDFPLEVPPLEVQDQLVTQAQFIENRRVAARLRIGNARDALARFRQSLVSDACGGVLTATWRAKHKPAPAGPELEERRRAMKANLGKRYRDPVIALDDLPELPEEWCWAALPELGELGRGKSKHRPRNDPSLYGGEYPFIQTGDVARSNGLITQHSQTYNEAGVAQSRIWPANTVCITIAANIANSGLLSYPACFPDSVVGLITDPSIALPEYVELFIRTARTNLSAFAPATAQANINLGILSQLAVALPPLEEQREIVRQTSGYLKTAHEVALGAASTSERVDQARQVTLRGVFAGSLTIDCNPVEGTSAPAA